MKIFRSLSNRVMWKFFLFFMLPHKRNLRKEGLKLLTVAWMRVCVCVCMFDFDFVRH